MVNNGHYLLIHVDEFCNIVLKESVHAVYSEEESKVLF